MILLKTKEKLSIILKFYGYVESNLFVVFIWKFSSCKFKRIEETCQLLSQYKNAPVVLKVILKEIED